MVLNNHTEARDSNEEAGQKKDRRHCIEEANATTSHHRQCIEEANATHHRHCVINPSYLAVEPHGAK
jgi:hypothetical protein